MVKFNAADFCNALRHLECEDPCFANEVPIERLMQCIEAHPELITPKVVDYQIAGPLLDAEIDIMANSFQEKIKKFIMLMQREQFRRVVLGPLEKKLQLNQGALDREYHHFTKNSHTFHDIFQIALQELPQGDPLKTLWLYEVMNKALLLGVQSPEKLQSYCCGLCTDNHSLLQPLLDFIKAIESELQIRLDHQTSAHEAWMQRDQLEIKLHPLLRSKHMGSAWTIPAISADGVMHFPLPAHPPQAQIHEENEKGHKEKKKSKKKKAKAKAKSLPQPVAEDEPCAEPCAEPEPPEAEPSHPQQEAPQSTRQPLAEPGIPDDHKHQCDCDGYGNALPEGSYIISLDAVMLCPYCVWRESLGAKLNVITLSV